MSRLVAGGATAIKIEPPWGDGLAALCKPWYDQLHAHVRVTRLDLKTSAGIVKLKEQLADSDVFLASQRPSALARLHLDAASLAREFPQLRHVNIVGDTTNPEEPGHDLTYQARAGLLQGVMPLTLLADMAGAERAHATIKDVMREPGGSRVVGLYDTLRDLAAPLYHGLTSPGGHLGRWNFGTRSTRHERARSPWARSSRTSASDCMKASDCRRATIRAPCMRPGRRLSGSSGRPPAICRCRASQTVYPHFLPATGMIGDGVNRRMHKQVLETAHRIATKYLDEVASRHVGVNAPSRSLRDALGGPLPQGGSDPVAVLNDLAARADAGIVASAGPRYFGFVTGGAVPVTVAADWIGSAWDQNSALYAQSPAAAVIEDVVSGWILELLDLPRTAGVGFVTGCHMANFTCSRRRVMKVLRRVGWNVETHGLQKAPRVRVIAGGEVHITAVSALRYLGFGTEEIELIPVDDQGRIARMRSTLPSDRVMGPSTPLIPFDYASG